MLGKKSTIEFMCVMISEISSSSHSQAGCMQILSKDGEMGGGRGSLFKWHHVIWIPASFLLLLSFPHPELFFPFWLRRGIIGTPSLPGQAAQDLGRFTSANTFGHWGESRSLFAKGAFCSERFWIMPYQAAMILTRALEESGGGGGVWAREEGG